MSNPPRTIRRDIRVFISAVTRELGSIRTQVKNVLWDLDCHPVEQRHFSLDYRNLIDKIYKRIDSCDVVIHIAGSCYGYEQKKPSPDDTRRSYTQLEYEIAVKLKKRIYVILTDEGFPVNPNDPEIPELQELQEAHRQRLTSNGNDYSRVASAEELDRKIRSLSFQVELREEELQQVDQKVADLDLRLQAEQRAQQQEREKQERERIAAEAAREEAQKAKDVYRVVAERFLQQLLNNKEITAEEARQRAIKELPALVDLSLAEIESLIDRKIPPQAIEADQSPLDKARAAVAKGDYDAVFLLAAEQARQGREMAMLEGTAALARFRQSPSPEWNEHAVAAFRRALALADPKSATEWEAWIVAAVSAALVSRDLARYAEAEHLQREALKVCESKVGPDSPEIAKVLNNLAAILGDTNQLAEAEPLNRRVLAINERSYGPYHPEVAVALSNLATLLLGTNRPTEAEMLFRRALAIDERSYGPAHPNFGTSLNNLAVLLDKKNQSSETEPLHRRALAIDEWWYGPDHPRVANRLNNLAMSLKAMNRLAEAETLFRRALAISERSHGPEHPYVAIRLNNLAILLQDTNRLSEAEPLYRRALAIDERSYGPEHPDVARDLNNLATMLRVANRLAEAEPLLARCLSVFIWFYRSTGHEHPNQQGAIRNYVGLLSSQNLADPEILARGTALSEETGKLTPIVPEVERLLGPAKPIADVLASLDRQYREQGKPAVWFLPLTEPIGSHLDQLLGPCKTVKEVLDGLNAQYRKEGKPAVWFLPLNEPISPHLDELLGKPSE